jgi:hypothetical protein
LIPIPPPYQIQHRASEAAFELLNSFADRLTVEQRIRIYVIQMVAPERLGWDEVGDALATWTLVVSVRV